MSGLPLDPTLALGFLAASILLVMSPGPDTMLILRNTLVSGRQTGLATVLGVQLGLVVHTAAAVLGLSLLIASSPVLFKAIAVLGAAYLAWLGIESFRHGFLPVDEATADARVLSPARGLRDAILTNVLNPKVILLFIAMMPNFVAVERGRVPLQLFLLALLLMAINIVWQVALWAATERARRWLGRPAVQRGVAWTTGAVLLLFSLLMILDHAT